MKRRLPREAVQPDRDGRRAIVRKLIKQAKRRTHKRERREGQP